MTAAAQQVSVDGQGRLLLPPGVAGRLGAVPGTALPIQQGDDTVTLRRSRALLSRIYVEPTNLCNLNCSTCVRNVWDEPWGRMSSGTFERVLDGLKAVQPTPTLFFGGFGEPFAHPDLPAMVEEAKAVGGPVELITNGTALDEKVMQGLVRVGLDRLWVSIDGATPEGYADVRMADALTQIKASLTRLAQLRRFSPKGRPNLGIATVVMKRNIGELGDIIRLGQSLGADAYSVSNVLAHTPEMGREILYGNSMYVVHPEMAQSPWAPAVSLPRMDVNQETAQHLAKVDAALRYRVPRGRSAYGGAVDTCPFVEKGSMSVRWDGAVSPCLPLLHTHRMFLDFRERTNYAHVLGNVNERPMVELWEDPAYATLRERLAEFDFSPCVFCNSCDMAEENLEDCYGSPTPACGGCLWAQGFIQCP